MSASAMPLEPRALTLEPRVTSAAGLRVQVISDAATFAELRHEWNELLAASASDTLFLTWEWLHTWWMHLSGGRELTILTVRRGAQLAALAPLVSSRPNVLGAPRLEFLGTGRVGSDYLDVVVRRDNEPEVVQALADALMRLGATLDLRQTRLTASTVSDLARALGAAGSWLRARRTHRCPFIEFGGRSWEAYLRDLGPQHRQDFHRKLKKLDTLHEMTFECVDSEARRRELLPVVFELHRRRWSERGGSDGLEGPGLGEFHEELTRIALERGWLRLFLLWVDGAPAATLYGFRYGGVFYFYQSGFDPRFGRLSVGLVTMGLAIKSAIEEGASEFDLLHGEEAYKFHWAKRTRRLARLVSFPPSVRGRVAYGAAAARDAARRLVRAWRRPETHVPQTQVGGPHAAPAR
jgi:CelD/BcsL family acetyltransferase involved in cellulose biosynthesis